MDLKPLISVIKIASLIGSIITCVLMTLLVYKKLEIYYPDMVHKHKWFFYVLASVLSFQMFFIYQKYISRF